MEKNTFIGIKTKILLGILCILFAHGVSANRGENSPLIVLTGNEELYPIGKKVFLFEDKSQTLTLDEVRKLKDQFVQSDANVPAFGFTTTVVWAWFSVKNTSDQRWYLEINTPYLYKIDLYTENASGSFDQAQTGLHIPFDARAVRINHFALPLEIENGETKTFYLRVESQTVVNFPLRIATIQQLYETNHIDDIVNGICFGLIIALSLYNLFVFLSLRDKTYLYYVLYILSFMINLSWIKGYLQVIIPVTELNLNHSNYPSAAVFIFLVLFTNSFLSIEKYAPRLKWLGYVFYFLNGLSFIFTVLGSHLIGFNLIMFQVFLMIPYVVLMCAYTLSKGYRPARFYLFGFSCFTIGAVVFVLKDHGILPHNVFTLYSMQMGSAIEALVLSFALADKLHTFKKEKEESQALALAQSNEFARQLIRSQEDERRRIAGELHDSIGQSLGIVKNKVTLLKKHDPRIEAIDRINGLVAETIQTVRSISYRLRPFQLDLLGLKQSLKSLAEDVSVTKSIEVSLSVDDIDNLFSKESEINIYRIVQEYLNVLLKKTDTKEARITIKKQGYHLILAFQDDGSVLQAVQEERSFAISGIIKRIKILGGSIRIQENERSATTIRIEIPIPVEVYE